MWFSWITHQHTLFANGTLTNQLVQHCVQCAIPDTIPPFYNEDYNTINDSQKQ